MLLGFILGIFTGVFFVWLFWFITRPSPRFMVFTSIERHVLHESLMDLHIEYMKDKNNSRLSTSRHGLIKVLLNEMDSSFNSD